MNTKSLDYCLPESKFPSDEQILPGICTYGPESIWFGVIGNQIESKGDQITVPLYNKQYDKNKNGTIIPVDDRQDVSQNVFRIKVPPTVKVDFFTDELCSSESIFTVGGEFLKVSGYPDFDAYGDVNLFQISSDVRCMKMTQVEDFSTFVEHCQNGTTPQNLCQQYASTSRNPNQGGSNNIDTGNSDDNFVPNDSRGFFYAMLFLGLFIIVMIVIIMMWVRNDQIGTRKHLNEKSYKKVQDKISKQDFLDQPTYTNQANDWYLIQPSAPPLSE